LNTSPQEDNPSQGIALSSLYNIGRHARKKDKKRTWKKNAKIVSVTVSIQNLKKCKKRAMFMLEHGAVASKKGAAAFPLIRP